MPQHLVGRINACYRFVVTGVTPIGALLGGTLGSLMELRLTLVIGALGTLTALCWVLFSPIAGLRDLPTVNDEELKKSEMAVARDSSA